MSIEYAIYIVQNKQGPEAHPSLRVGDINHVFLCLARPYAGERPLIEKEMHFVGRDGFIKTIIGVSPSRQYLPPYLDRHIIAHGDQDTVLPIWESACDFAREITDALLPFTPLEDPDPRAINCRAATIAVLEAMGMPYDLLIRHGLRGTEANLYDFFTREDYVLEPDAPGLY